MRIKNENITIKPFTIEYTKERVEWEEKQREKCERTVFFCACIIVGILIAMIIYGISWIIVFVVIMTIIHNDYSIENVAAIPVRKIMKWYYTLHIPSITSPRKIASIQETWRRIEKSIKEGTAEVDLSEEKGIIRNSLQLVLNIKYEDFDKTVKEEKFVVSNESDDKKKEDLLISDSLTISFYDVKNEDWWPFEQNNYVQVS